MTDEQFQNGILRALRRITRSIDLHSRELVARFGLTGPQLICLRYIAEVGQATPGSVAREVSLSQATITGIIDRLVSRGWVTRLRGDLDRRQITLSITEEGSKLVQRAPHPLQQSFIERLSEQPAEAQRNILATLEQVVCLMDGEGIDAAPMLSTTTQVAGLPEDSDESLDTAAPQPALALGQHPSVRLGGGG